MEKSSERRHNKQELSHIIGKVNDLGSEVSRVCVDCGEEFEARNLGPWTVSRCPRCNKQRLERDRLLQAEQERKQAEGRRLELIRLAHIPPKWVDTRFENSNPDYYRKSFNFCKQWAMNFSMRSASIILYSEGNRVGKSHIAACILNHVLFEKQVPVRWEKARDLLLELRRTFSVQGESEADVLGRMSYVKLLVLDDVGRDPASTWVHDTYWTIFDRRIEWGLPVIITTNLPIEPPPGEEGLADRIGEGAFARVLELCQGQVLDMTGKAI